MADITKEQVIDFIANMTVLELSEFIKVLEDKFGVSAAAPAMAMMAMPAGGAAEAAPVEEKTEFDVILTGAGGSDQRLLDALRHHEVGHQAGADAHQPE